MSLVTHCPSCSKRYEVAESFRDKRVRCKECGHTFTVTSGATPAQAPAAASDLWSETDFSQLPVVTATAAPIHVGTVSERVSNPSGGPTDPQMRLVSGAMLGLGMMLLLGSLATEAMHGVVYLAAVGLAPLAIVLGIAGLISPDVVRACGKYGGHLPPRYKLIGWGVIGLSFVLMVLLFVGLFLAGFKPDRPGARNRPRLGRADTAAECGDGDSPFVAIACRLAFNSRPS